MQALMMAGQVLSVVGTLAQGNQAADVAGRNADAMKAQATETRRTTVDRENLTRDRSAQTLAAQRTALLQNGIDPTAGTAAIGVSQSTQDADMDALTLRYQGLLQAQQMDTQADLTRWEGQAKKRQSRISAVGQLMSASSGYLGGKQAPAPVETRTPIPSPYFRG